MFKTLKKHWPDLSKFFGNFYTMAIVVLGSLFVIGVWLPPLINGDFLSMFLGIALAGILLSVSVVSIGLFLETIAE